MIASAWNNAAKSAKLGAAILVAFGGATWRIRAAMTEIPATQPGKVVSIGGDRAASPTSAGVAVLREHDERDESWTGQDPFRPFEPERTASPAESALKGGDTPLTSTPAGPIAPVASAGLPPAAYEGPKERVASTSAAPVKLTGVVVGAQPTAVVMVGEEEKVMRPGERLPDGSTLVRIDRISATFVREGRKSILWVSD